MTLVKIFVGPENYRFRHGTDVLHDVLHMEQMVDAVRRLKLIWMVTVLVAVALVIGSRYDSAVSEVVLLYVGSQDCAPCRVWQDGEGAQFRTSPEYARLTYREVKSATVFEVLKDENWPEDMRPYRDRLGQGAAVPMWLVIADGEVVSREYGTGRWGAAVLPKLRSLVRAAKIESRS